MAKQITLYDRATKHGEIFKLVSFKGKMDRFEHVKSLNFWVWLSGLSAGLQTKRLQVQFSVRAHAWVAA